MGEIVSDKDKLKGLSLEDLIKKFPDDETAEEWLIGQRWPDGVSCAYCMSLAVSESSSHPTMPFRCRGCRKFFSAKTGSIMQSSKLGYRTWVLAIFLLTTNIKGTSIERLHHDLGTTHKAAWFMAHRIREAWDEYDFAPNEPKEESETSSCEREQNRYESAKPNIHKESINNSAVNEEDDRDGGQMAFKW